MHAWNILTRAEDALMADTRDNLVGNLNVWCLDAWKHIVLHPLHGHMHWLSTFEIGPQETPVCFRIGVFDLLQQDGVVACHLLWFLGGDLVFELASHDDLLILELLLLIVYGHRVGLDRPFKLKPDVSHHFLAT